MNAYIFCAFAFNSFKDTLNIKIKSKIHHYRKKNDMVTRPNPEIVLLKGWDRLLIVLKHMSTNTPTSVSIDMAEVLCSKEPLKVIYSFQGYGPED